jgi:protein-histidine pros-kinase
LLDWLPDGVVVVDDTGRIVYANRQTERLTGFGRSELLGRPIELLVPTRLRRIHRVHRACTHRPSETTAHGSR